MASATDQLLGEALKLDPDDRAKLATELLATLEPDIPSEHRNERQWLDEIERRARDAMAGSPSLSWNEAGTLISSRLAAR